MIEGFEDIGDLYDELDAAKERIEKLEAALRDVIDNFFDSTRTCEIARKALEGAADRIEKLEAALRFYASHGGDIARKALDAE